MPDNLNSYVKIFADDTKIYNSVSNSDLLTQDLSSLLNWSDKWLLPFNLDKCKVIHYGKKNTSVEYSMDGVAVNSDDIIKDLGVQFQDTLSFDVHISKICNTANSRLGIIKNTFHCISKDGFITLYKSLVRPILEYCNLIWFPHLRRHNIMIERIQRRATKLISELEMLSYTERLRALKLDTLYFRRRRADLIQVYRIINKLDHINFEDFFEFDTGRTRNNGRKLLKPRAMTSTKQHSFSHRVINDWNNLPNYIVISASLNIFKSNLSIHWERIDFRYTYDC